VQSASVGFPPTFFLFYPLPGPDVTTTDLSPEALRAAVDDLGFELVDVRIAGSAARRIVRLRIDVPGGGRPGHGITSGDCETVSRALEQQLEMAGVVGPAWTLEVSSPGIERPIRFVEHWRRYIGRAIRIKAAGLPGQQAARITAVPDDSHVTLELGGTPVTLSLEAIKEATLVVDWSTAGNREAGEL
jgi:ribosome maturation factor RimP